MAKEKAGPTKETFSFSAPIGFEQVVHRIADFYGKGHLNFSEKCVFCFEKIDSAIQEKGKSNGVSN